jgi:hypothetical protein
MKARQLAGEVKTQPGARQVASLLRRDPAEPRKKNGEILLRDADSTVLDADAGDSGTSRQLAVDRPAVR